MKPVSLKNLNSVAFLFVWEELANHFDAERLQLKAMFGCHAIYLDSKIIFILRRKDDPKTSRDNGIWIALADQAANSFSEKFHSLRPIEMFQTKGKQGFSAWLNLPENELEFETAAFEICLLVMKSDPRIGRLPKLRLSSKRTKTRKQRVARKLLRK